MMFPFAYGIAALYSPFLLSWIPAGVYPEDAQGGNEK
jgi:hypothetical protein